MNDATTIACELCNAELTVSEAALLDPKKLERDLPGGWTLYLRRDATTGKYVRVVRCPDHQP